MDELEGVEYLVDVGLRQEVLKNLAVEVRHRDEVLDAEDFGLRLLEAVLKLPEFDCGKTASRVWDWKRLPHGDDLRVFVGDELFFGSDKVLVFACRNWLVTWDVQDLMRDVHLAKQNRQVAEHFAEAADAVDATDDGDARCGFSALRMGAKKSTESNGIAPSAEVFDDTSDSKSPNGI